VVMEFPSRVVKVNCGSVFPTERVSVGAGLLAIRVVLKHTNRKIIVINLLIFLR
jgi:hypothetical protein